MNQIYHCQSDGILKQKLILCIAVDYRTHIRQVLLNGYGCMTYLLGPSVRYVTSQLLVYLIDHPLPCVYHTYQLNQGSQLWYSPHLVTYPELVLHSP